MTLETLTPPSLEEVISHLSCMKSFIESSNQADWAPFNTAKKRFLELFKTLANSPEKQKLWKEFTEVADSARSIRKVQEEEGEFAAEMIAKALDALEADVSNFQSQKVHHALFEKVPSFKKVAQELSSNLATIRYLSSSADKIQALREELTKTGMRLSIKGRLFDRLSTLGDKVFPVKKQSIQSVNELFKQGLESFQISSAKTDDGAELLFQIRVIQSFLKELVLKKSDYEAIKSMLDPIWKKATVLKEKQQVALDEQAQKSDIIKKSFEESFEIMKQLVTESKDDEALKIYDSLSLKLKDRTLLKNDFKFLKRELEGAARPLFDRMKEQKEIKKQQLEKDASALGEKKLNLLDRLKANGALEEKKMILDEAFSLNLSADEVYRFKYAYLCEVFASTQDQQKLEELYFDLKKIQESVRGLVATSGLDFSQSMSLQEISDDIKDLINKVVSKID